MSTNITGIFFPFDTKVFLLGPQRMINAYRPEEQEDISSQNQQAKPRKRQRKEDGRTTNIVPNIFKALTKSKKNLKKELLNISGKGRPKEWTMKAELVLLCLKYREIQSKERQIFTTQIKKILNKMIQFRNNKIEDKERVQFNLMNRNLLINIQRICLSLLNREAMPEPHEIKSILTELMKGNEQNQGSLVVQSAKITRGFDFILRQFPFYQDQIWQDKDISISETTDLSVDHRQKQPTSSQTQEKI